MAKDLKTLALARLSGFRHKTVKVPEWGNVSVVLREPSAEAWYLWQEVLNGDGEDDDTLSVVAKTRRNLEADVTLFCDVLCDTDLQRVFTPDDREQVLAVYGPVHARLLRQALELIADAESARKKEIRFLMRLALRLGRTLSELQHSLSASEAMMWMEFDRVSPLGDERGDIRNAQIVKAVFGAQGMNVALKDAMLCWGEDEDKPEVDPFTALEDALSFAAQS
jgi:hypothetical protein